MVDFAHELQLINKNLEEHTRKIEILKNKKLFVLDNSIRETTVGQLRGHTLEDKIKIFEETKRCGFKYQIVAAFTHCPKIGDEFCRYLRDINEDRSGMFSFSDVTEEIKDGRLNTEELPIALKKCKKYGIPNVQFEFDLVDPAIDWDKFSIEEYCELLEKRFDWCLKELSPNSKVLFGLRDLLYAMATKEGALRVLKVVQFLGTMKKRAFGITFEDASGRFHPEQVGAWCGAIRRVMDQTGWGDGKLLVHVHKRWGMSTNTQLECLVNGADGVWAGVCEEGAAIGHASSIVTIMNLIRMGNKNVLKDYNCRYLREAAVNVTKITTGKPPHHRELIYGERALDHWLPGDPEYENPEFDVAAFFNEKIPVRISDISSLSMFQQHLEDLFGKDPQFNKQMALKMKRLMLGDLSEGRKEEYMSDVGIAMLFNRAGGVLNSRMREAVQKSKVSSPRGDLLIGEIKQHWDRWENEEQSPERDQLSFNAFYYGVMAPYFDGYSPEDASSALKALGIDVKGAIKWSEFSLYLKWALRQYTEITSSDELLSIAFRKGLIPVMHEQNLKEKSSRAQEEQTPTRTTKLPFQHDANIHLQRGIASQTIMSRQRG